MVHCQFEKSDGLSRRYQDIERDKIKYRLIPSYCFSGKKNMGFNVWSNLYKQSLLEGIQFIEGIHFEDVLFLLTVLARHPKIVSVDEKLYFYTINENSISYKRANPKQIRDYHNKVIFCGNGGSATQSQHLAAELVGRYKLNRPAMNALSLTVDTSNITAVGNDYGYDVVFSRQLEGIGKTGDVLIGLSTSGNSKNVVVAFEQAVKMGIKTVALVGQREGQMHQIADYTVAVPATTSAHIQEMHIAVGHLICDLIEQAVYG